jgi:predicted DsbA family dithiol-disulfide isomerase
MRPVRALPLALLLGLFAAGASCDEGRKEDEAAPSSTAGAEQRVTAAELGVTEASKLEAEALRRYERLINELLSPCGEPISVGRCARGAGTCAACRPAVQYLARLVDEGYERGEIEELYRLRFDPSKQVQLDVGESPVRGSPMAPVTIVEFSDFECPFCAAAHPVLERVVSESDGKVRLVFKQFPLESHPNARAAARATVAAGKQGKFWEMHDRLFDNQDALDPASLSRHARELGLDMERFRKDMGSEETEARIEADRALGRRAGIRGTPSIFINGRLYEGGLRSLPAYIEEELLR